MDNTVRQLIDEYDRISREYEQRTKDFEASVIPLLERKSEIVQILIHNNGAVRPRTQRQVGRMLGISGTRVGQLLRRRFGSGTTPA